MDLSKYLKAEQVDRIKEFYRSLDGWDGRKSKALEPKSMQYFLKFIDCYMYYKEGPLDAEVFMTRWGNVEMVWQAKNCGTVEVEFLTENKLKYYIEETDETEVCSSYQLVRKLGRLEE